MAATVASEPVNYASVYRPMQFVVNRTDPAGTLIVEVFIADSSDVSALGNGLQVGDVVVNYTGTVFGSTPVAAGQTILMDSDCGPYAGVQLVTNYFVDGSDKYAVIDAANAGDFTPASMLGSFKVWLNNYTSFCRVLIYTDPTGDPQTVDLSKLPDQNGNAKFDVSTVIRDYFSHRIDTLMGDGVLFNAHGIAALFYRVHIAEAYDQPSGVLMDPFDGTHTIEEDDTEEVSSFRVAVNAVHPYHGASLSWADTSLSAFALGSSSKKFLTNAPRRITLGRNDKFRLTILTDQAEDYSVSARRVITVTGVGAEGTDLEITDPSAAFTIACGPADIAGLFGTEPTSYTVVLRDLAEPTVMSETITIDVDDKCTEVRRPFGWLNKLGGLDMYSFTGREILSSKVKRASVRKPYGTGTGFDWTERQYSAQPERSAVVSTKPVNKDIRKWLCEDLFESANINTVEDGRTCPCILLTDEVVSNSSGPYYKPVTLEYRLGVSNISQRC